MKGTTAIEEVSKLRDRLISVPAPITEEYLKAHGFHQGFLNLSSDYIKETSDYVIAITLLPRCDVSAGISCYNKKTEISCNFRFDGHSGLKFKAVKEHFTYEDLYNICKLCGIEFD